MMLLNFCVYFTADYTPIRCCRRFVSILQLTAHLYDAVEVLCLFYG